jgi:hypothetical protein
LNYYDENFNFAFKKIPVMGTVRYEWSSLGTEFYPNRGYMIAFGGY